MIVLAIGAHPDDIELGCAGTLLKHVEHGDEVHILVVTNGEAQEGVNWKHRTYEAAHSAALMGVEGIRFLGREERQVCFSDHGLIAEIRKAIEVRGPGVVYCHAAEDKHQTHVAVAEATKVACELAGVLAVHSFEVPSVTHGFCPTMYVDITKHLEKKIEALNCFKSQFGKYYMLAQRVEGLARVRAFEATHGHDDGGRFQAAEVFQVERMVVR